MKTYTKYILTLFLLVSFGSFHAQTLTPEFQFTLRISDAAAHKDSVVIGYDPLATDGMDTAFGETGMSSFTPFDSLFEARLAYDNGFGSWNYTKRSIIYKHNAACVSNSSLFMAIPLVVRVKKDAFPIMIAYDNSLFSGSSCHDSTTITPLGGYPIHMKKQAYFNLSTAGGVILINRHYPTIAPYVYIDSIAALLNTSAGAVPGYVYAMMIYISTYDFINYLVLGIKDHQIPQLESKVYPNPAQNEVSITVSEPAWCYITDMSGKVVQNTYLQTGTTATDVSALPKGLYLMRLQGKDHRYSVHKLVVE